MGYMLDFQQNALPLRISFGRIGFAKIISVSLCTLASLRPWTMRWYSSFKRSALSSRMLKITKKHENYMLVG